MTRSSAKQRRRRRSGYLLLELLLLLPILLVVVLAAVEFGMLLHARQQLVAASREACRVAAVGGTAEEATDLARRVLGPGRLGSADVLLTTEEGVPLLPGHCVATGETVAAWVRLPAHHAVPDLLRFIGVSIKQDELVGRTVMRRE
ncbi:MAG TPA: TadE/TadG family type IV pilus assembly protein [Gemmatales bacterium]|nr:TadE/TadG family type IV pilus assembly protein [Gemmatales bacterium]HMP59309.1 TadE/TadG family type IV pilus assembly protein [Gemmatales bacterium]